MYNTNRPSTAHPLRAPNINNNEEKEDELILLNNNNNEEKYRSSSSPPRPSSAPLSRILSRSSSAGSNISINYKRRNYVKNALTQVHDGLMVSTLKPELRNYLTIKKSRPRRPWRNMAIQPSVDWHRLLSDASGHGNEHHHQTNTKQKYNRLNQSHANKVFRDKSFVAKLIKIITPFASKEKRIAATKSKGFKAFAMVNKNNKGEFGTNIFGKTAKQKELDEKNILRRSILKRGKINAFDDSKQKINSEGTIIIESELLRAQSDQNRFDLNKLQSEIGAVMVSTGRAQRILEHKRNVAHTKKLRKNAEKASHMVGRLNNFTNANWFWTIPVAALQKADETHLQQHRELLLSLRGGEKADAIAIVKQVQFDHELEVSWESLTNLEYELLVEDEHISRQIVDLWLDYLFKYNNSTAPQIVSRKCCRYMSKLFNKGYTKEKLLKIWKVVSTSRVYRKLLLRLGTETSIHRIKRSTLAAVGKARRQYESELQTDLMWKYNYSKVGVGVKQKVNAGRSNRLLEVRRSREKRAARIKHDRLAKRNPQGIVKRYLKEAKMIRRLRPSTAKW